MMEIWETGRPSKDNSAFLVAAFYALANGVCWMALPIEHGEWGSVSPNLTVGLRGASGQNSLSNSADGERH